MSQITDMFTCSTLMIVPFATQCSKLLNGYSKETVKSQCCEALTKGRLTDIYVSREV